MNRRGVCYDAGRVLMGHNWRPVFDRNEVRRELEIIKSDLHCNAVRICGLDLHRLAAAGREALAQGLEVWLSPELWDESPAVTLDYIASAASTAEELRREQPGRLVFSVGSELTLFMQGIVEGRTFLERMHHPSFWERVRAGAHNAPLDDFLRRANDIVRQSFHGSVTYVSVPLETVDWCRFDFVCTDLYREARIREMFPSLVAPFLGRGRPLVITESGCCTYRGAADTGGMGWAIVDYTKRPPELKGHYVRDEAEQAREIIDVLTIFDRTGVDGAFVMTFVAPIAPYSKNPRYDLDMASYSLVKSFGSRLGPFGVEALTERTEQKPPAPVDSPWDAERMGSTYPEMPWEPKQSFRALARYYGAALHTTTTE